MFSIETDDEPGRRLGACQSDHSRLPKLVDERDQKFAVQCGSGAPGTGDRKVGNVLPASEPM
jgi:hypothetical protein